MKFADTRVEGLVLGAVMDADGTLLRSTPEQVIAATGLSGEDFTNSILKAAFGVCVAMATNQRSTHPEAIWAILKAQPGASDAIFARLLELHQCNVASMPALLGHAEELRRLSHLRRLETFHRSQLEQLERAKPDPALLASAVSAFSGEFSASADSDETAQSDLTDVLEQWDASVRGERQPYVETGIQVLDQVCRGFVANLNVVGGLPSVGKSALIAEVVWNCIERGLKVGLFGLEDATSWVVRRHLARKLGIPVGDIGARRLSELQSECLETTAAKMYPRLENLLVYRRAGITPELLLQKSRHWILNKGAKLIVIDHGGEVQHQNAQARDRFDLAVANTYRGLRDLAVNSRVPIVVLCHFNRDADNGGKPSRSSFAETAYIERMARLALGLWETDDDPEAMRVTILKRTDGPRDITMRLPRDKEAGLIKSTGGGVIDLREEEESRASTRRSKDWRSQR